MVKTIFDYQNYKLYLLEQLRLRPRGEQGKLAVALHCHSGYISQVLHGKAHFSLEQGIEINLFFEHSKARAEYFLLLLQRERAGTDGLRAHFENQMKELLEKQLILKNRFKIKKSLSTEDQTKIYSSWHYAAIHVAVLVPSLRTPAALSAYFGIPAQRVRRILKTLLSIGLVREDENTYQIGPTHVHLDHDSPMISHHHTQWRLRALESIDQTKIMDLHYSSVVTISKSDAPKAREILTRAIEEVRSIIKPSRDEAVYAYCVDWFGLDVESRSK